MFGFFLRHEEARGYYIPSQLAMWCSGPVHLIYAWLNHSYSQRGRLVLFLRPTGPSLRVIALTRTTLGSGAAFTIPVWFITNTLSPSLWALYAHHITSRMDSFTWRIWLLHTNMQVFFNDLTYSSQDYQLQIAYSVQQTAQNLNIWNARSQKITKKLHILTFEKLQPETVGHL